MSLIGRTIADLDTPALLVDRARLEANIRRFAQIAQQAGVKLRPHIKTHKTVEIGAMQLEAGAGGVSSAKLSEAEIFAGAGVKDIFIAYPVVGVEKARRAARLALTSHLIVGVESAKGIQQLSEAATEAGATIFVRVEVNSGMDRTGVDPSEVEALCRLVLGASGLELDGIFTFRSNAFAGARHRDAETLGREEGELMVGIAAHLRAVGIAVHTVSAGSTPTGPAAATVPGITEIRPGTYVFFDRMTTRSGVSSLDEVALSILATVVSRPAPDMAVIDAGSKTFCGDVVPAHAGLEGYGVTSDGEKGIVVRMSEEHGIVRLAPGFAPEVGEKLLFYPNHVCTSVNLSDELLIVQDGVVEQVWQIAARGKRQ